MTCIFFIKEKQNSKTMDKDELSALLDDALMDYERLGQKQSQSSDLPIQSAESKPSPPMESKVQQQQSSSSSTSSVAPQKMTTTTATETTLMAEENEEAALRNSVAAFEEYLASATASLQKDHEEHAQQDEGSAASALVELFRPFISKELLYGPLCELRNKFPQWLDQHRSQRPLSPEELTTREAQYNTICRICEFYEKQGDAGSNKGNESLTELVQLIEQMGQPPQDLVQELALSLPSVPGPQSSSDPQCPLM